MILFFTAGSLDEHSPALPGGLDDARSEK